MVFQKELGKSARCSLVSHSGPLRWRVKIYTVVQMVLLESNPVVESGPKDVIRS